MLKLFFIVLLLSILINPAFSQSQLPDYFDSKTRPKKLGLLFEKNENNTGCVIKHIIPFSPSWENQLSGQLKIGDNIVGVNNNINNKAAIKIDPSHHATFSCPQIINKIKSLLSQQETTQIELKLWAKAQVVQIKLKAAVNTIFSLQGFKRKAFKAQKTAELFSYFPSINNNLNKLVSTHKLNQPILIKHQSTFKNLSHNLFVPRLALIASIQNQPDKIMEFLFPVLDSLINHKQPTPISFFWNKICPLLFQCNMAIKMGSSLDISLFERLQHIQQQVADDLSQAFILLSKDERSFFNQQINSLQETLKTGELLAFDLDLERKKNNIQMFSIASKIDYQSLSYGFSHLLKLIEPQLIDEYKNINNSKAFPLLTSSTHIVIGSNKDDTHHIRPGMIIIDPGGNDTYQLQQHSGSSNNNQATVIIDLSGNDIYLNTGGAILGLSLLMDQQGNDIYKGKYWSQGSAFAGISLHYDQSGDDIYQAEALSQASALFGLGVLIDSDGNDSYQVNHHGQALGLPYGLGILIDQQGNDNYQMLKKLPSAYNTKNSFQSWGQATGMGFRYLLPGGMGILLDQQGSDNFNAGEFAQGGGYYYGLGLILNAGDEDDHYQGSRYNAGYSAHQAIGAFIDSGGNDSYISNGSAMAGLAWDQSLSVFIDQYGLNKYKVGNFSLGAADKNSLSLFYQ
jgi:hypothetical protein